MEYVSLESPMRGFFVHNDRMQQHGVVWVGEELDNHPDNHVNLFSSSDIFTRNFDT